MLLSPYWRGSIEWIYILHLIMVCYYHYAQCNPSSSWLLFQCMLYCPRIKVDFLCNALGFWNGTFSLPPPPHRSGCFVCRRLLPDVNSSIFLSEPAVLESLLTVISNHAIETTRPASDFIRAPETIRVLLV